MSRPVVTAFDEGRVREQLRRLLEHNTRDGYSRLLNRHYCYVAPALGTYPYQWFWDSCLNVIMLTRLGEFEMAQRNLRSLFTMQEDDGFVGHMVFWRRALPHQLFDVIQARPSMQTIRPHMSAMVQPPLAGFALLTLFRACGDRVFMGELYAKVRRLHEWLAAHRDFDGDGVLSIISPFESGMDWKASYDEVLGHEPRVTPRRLRTSSLYWKVIGVDTANFLQRYDLARIRARHRFIVKDAGFNAIYARDLQAMEELAREIGDDPERFARRRERLAQGMLALMFDAEARAFFDVQEPGGRKLRVCTPTLLFPLDCDLIPQSVADNIVAEHLRPGGDFDVPLPIPTVRTDDPAFHRGQTPYLWRGPTWSVVNWFLCGALRRRGFHAQADRLRDAMRELVARSGFREYYDPYTGEGLGAKDFTWSGLVVDM